MYQECEKCGTVYNDEFRDTICPHKGIGYCEICDCVICNCDPARKAEIHARRMPQEKQ
jgi:hypothetical protein